MVHFLIHRPIATTMTFLALLLLGLVTTTRLPVSLMPDIDIPVISVRITSSELPARQLENTITKPLRNVLKEVNNVESLKSETRDGSAWIELRFRHGTPIDLASVEVNEKVDKAMNFLPREIRRPEVVRASASDLPVFYLMVSRKGTAIPQFIHAGNDYVDSSSSFDEITGDNELLPLSNFSSQVIRKRLEQLPEVALVDMSGLQFPEIKISPRSAYIQNGAFSIALLEQVLLENNVDLGNLLIRDGQYQYNIRFNSRLRSVDDIKNIPVKTGEKIVPLSILADVQLLPQETEGTVRYNTESAISMAIIKQSDARLAGLRKELEQMITFFKTDYPEIEFNVTRDQTRLLEYSISNLGQSLLIGGLLAFLSMFLFLRERRAPWLIGISIPVSLIISLLFFFLTGLSINIISLSGLVLGVGMMIDNSIIVIDNITQHRKFNLKAQLDLIQHNHFNHLTGLSSACINGTNEVIRPLISSVLTTCAVFIPLIFMKGMAGALFFDQAMAVSIGLIVSLLVAITLLPVLYRLFYLNHSGQKDSKEKEPAYYRWYQAGLRFVLRRQLLSGMIFILMILSGIALWFVLPVSQFPEISHDEILVEIDWNEPLTLEENTARTATLLNAMETQPIYVIEEAGQQQYLLSSNGNAGTSENKLFIKTTSEHQLEEILSSISKVLNNKFPEAEYHFSESDNLFNLAFGKPESPLVAKFIHYNPGGSGFLNDLTALQRDVSVEFNNRIESQLITRRLILLEADPERILFYRVDQNELYRQVKSAFNTNTVFTINDNNMFVPVSISTQYQSVYDIIQHVTVANQNGEQIPLSGLVKVSAGTGLKNIVAGKEGEYFPVRLNITPKEFQESISVLNAIAENHAGFDVNFGGSILANRSMLNELIVIIGISLLLLYFVLSVQFESFILPFIVLTEVPLNLFGVFLLLKLFGTGINIMSGIGIIVMAGIVINDSILKVDTINKLVDGGHTLLRSIYIGGHRRLKPILMTSLTTILALLPFLFQKGMGAELQLPLSLAIIGGMITGTLVSLFLIPLMYYSLRKKALIGRDA
ncbi:MAG TPA: efflux RND transporter permease subunit [Mariniphaga sp.]|nr:efflux RND transporter permease subunit [Mariniphaga sp.]